MRRCRCLTRSASCMGDTLAITCKTSGTLVFHDAASLERVSTVPMPGLTHELAASWHWNEDAALIGTGSIRLDQERPDLRLRGQARHLAIG